MEDDAFERFDYSDLIARCSIELDIARLSWRSPLVAGWLGEVGAPCADWLDLDGFTWILERLAIYICDGGTSG